MNHDEEWEVLHPLWCLFSFYWICIFRWRSRFVEYDFVVFRETRWRPTCVFIFKKVLASLINFLAFIVHFFLDFSVSSAASSSCFTTSYSRGLQDDMHHGLPSQETLILWRRAIYISLLSFLTAMVLCVAGVVLSSLRSSASTAAFAVSTQENIFSNKQYKKPLVFLSMYMNDHRYRIT